MRTDDMLEACEMLDQAGYHSLEVWGGATFDSCIRFLNEDPWERLRTLRKALPNTQLQMLLRGQNILGYRHYGDDVVEKFVEKSAENGIDIIRIFDALNDVRNLETAIKATKKYGKHAQGTISYTISPVHNNELFVELGTQLENMGVDSIAIKDMAGLLAPEPARELVTNLKKHLKVPIQLHTHATSGFALMSYVRAIDAGIDVLDCAISTLSGGTSQPPTETVVAALQNTPWDTGMNLDLLTKIGKHFGKIRKNYTEFESQFTGVDTNVLSFQIPGGMMSNLETQLREQGQAEKIDQVLEEVPRVRKDLGYPPLVTPTSQIVGTQAVMNVIAGERYKMITKETSEYVKGNYGQPQGEVDPVLIKKVCGEIPPITCRPADLIKPEFENIKKEYGHIAKTDEELLICALFPGPGKQFLENKGKPAPEKKVEPKPAADLVVKEKPTPTPVEPIDRTAEGFTDFEIIVNDNPYHVSVRQVGGDPSSVQPVRIQRAPVVKPRPSAAPSPSPTPKPSTPAPAPAPEAGGGTPLNAEISGKVLAINVNVGDTIDAGQPIIKLEAMKMEIDVEAKQAGKVTSIPIHIGDAIQSGQPLLFLE